MKELSKLTPVERERILEKHSHYIMDLQKEYEDFGRSPSLDAAMDWAMQDKAAMENIFAWATAI